jgi:hypothetical protein
MLSPHLRRVICAILVVLAIACVIALMLGRYHIVFVAIFATLMTTLWILCALLLVWCATFVRDEPTLVRWTSQSLQLSSY